MLEGPYLAVVAGVQVSSRYGYHVTLDVLVDGHPSVERELTPGDARALAAALVHFAAEVERRPT